MSYTGPVGDFMDAGNEEGELVGAMSGVDVDDNRSGGEDAGGGGGRGGSARVTISMGPHGMISSGIGRGRSGHR